MGKPLFKSAKQIAVDAQALKLAVQRGDRVSSDKSTVRYEDEDSAYINTVLPDVVVTPKYNDYDDYNKTIAARDRRALEQQQHEMNNHVREGMNKAGEVVAGAMMMLPPVAAADPIAAGVGYLGKSLAPAVAKTAAAAKKFLDPTSLKYALSPLKPGYTRKYIKFVDNYADPTGNKKTAYMPNPMAQTAVSRLVNKSTASTRVDRATIDAPIGMRQGTIMHELGHAHGNYHMVSWDNNSNYFTLRKLGTRVSPLDKKYPDVSVSTFTKENYPALTARREYFNPETPNLTKPKSRNAWYASPEEIFSEYLNYRVTGKSKAAALRALDKRFNGSINPLSDKRILPDEFKRVINTYQKVSGMDEHLINQTRMKFGYIKPGSLPDWAESFKNPLNHIPLGANEYGLAYALKRDAAAIGSAVAAGKYIIPAAVKDFKRMMDGYNGHKHDDE